MTSSKSWVCIIGLSWPCLLEANLHQGRLQRMLEYSSPTNRPLTIVARHNTMCGELAVAYAYAGSIGGLPHTSTQKPNPLEPKSPRVNVVGSSFLRKDVPSATACLHTRGGRNGRRPVNRFAKEKEFAHYSATGTGAAVQSTGGTAALEVVSPFQFHIRKAIRRRNG